MLNFSMVLNLDSVRNWDSVLNLTSALNFDIGLNLDSVLNPDICTAYCGKFGQCAICGVGLNVNSVLILDSAYVGAFC